MKITAPDLRPASLAAPVGTQKAQQILIVDADESARSVLAVALGRDGFQTLAASSATEALRQIARDVPELLVVSSELRQENGFNLIAQLRGDRRTAHLPILLLAKGDEAQFHQLSRAAGADEVLLKPAFARDIATLARLQLSPQAKDGGRVLDTAVAPLPHLLRAVLATSRSGVIETEKGRGHIAFRKGKVLDASFGGVHGVNGVARTLALSRGRYTVTPRSLAFDAAFHFTLKELVNTVFPRLQKWDALTVRSLPLDAKLGLDFGALAKALPSMPDAVNGVVRLFDGLRDVREVLIDSPLDETVTLEVATRLYLMGVVVPVSADDATGVARRNPSLFEPRPNEATERMESLFATNATPIQVLAEAPAEDPHWEDEIVGAGLDVGDPSAGWTLARPAQVELQDEDAGSDLAAEVQAQLDAFNIQPVVENDARPPLFAKDLVDFTTGEQADEEPPMAAALAPVVVPLPAAVKAPPIDLEAEEPTNPSARRASEIQLEAEFFELERPEAQGSVSEAVLGLTTDETELPVEEGEPSRIGAMGWTAIVALLVTATALTAWQLSSNNEPPAPVVAETIATPLSEAEPIHLTTAHVEPLEPVIETAAGEAAVVPPSEALLAAKRLYDNGQLKQAIAALEAVVADDGANTQAWVLLGLARFDNGDNAGAEDAVNTVLALDPKAARAYLIRATILIDQKNRAAAQAEIQKYLELEPDGPYADEAKALLKR